MRVCVCVNVLGVGSSALAGSVSGVRGALAAPVADTFLKIIM